MAVGVGGVESGFGGDEVHAEGGEVARRTVQRSRGSGGEGVGVIRRTPGSARRRSAAPARRVGLARRGPRRGGRGRGGASPRRASNPVSAARWAACRSVSTAADRAPLAASAHPLPRSTWLSSCSCTGWSGERGELGDGGVAAGGIGAHSGGEGDSTERPAQRRDVVELASQSGGVVEVTPGGGEPTAVDGDQSVQQREGCLQVVVVGGDGRLVATASPRRRRRRAVRPRRAHTPSR